MTAREKAIEAARLAYMAQDEANYQRIMEDRDDLGPDPIEPAVEAAAPHIESALLDRIEEKVAGLRSEVFADNFGAGYNRALDSVLAALTEIREGK